jgi:hypothetical protein
LSQSNIDGKAKPILQSNQDCKCNGVYLDVRYTMQMVLATVEVPRVADGASGEGEDLQCELHLVCVAHITEEIS